MPQKFLLTRVTRIFEKPIFTKTALAGAHGTPLRTYSFADASAAAPGGEWAQPTAAGDGPRSSFSLFPIDTINDFCNSGVLIAFAGGRRCKLSNPPHWVGASRPLHRTVRGS